MVKQRQLTLEYVLQCLTKRGLLSKEQHREIISKAPSLKSRILKADHPHARRMRQAPYAVSPIEVVAAFGFALPDGQGDLSEDLITTVIAEESGFEFRKLDPLKLSLEVVTAHVPRPFALKHLVIPIEEKKGIVTFATADPFDLDAIESIQSARKIRVHVVLSPKADIMKIIREFFGFRSAVSAAAAEISSSVELSSLEQYVRLKGHDEIEANDQHIVNAVDYILQYAFEQRASDIHVEPKKDKTLIRMRIDGILHAMHTVPKSIHAPLISRIKMLSRMDIAEKRRPQDGRIKTKFMDKDIEIRVSTIPVAFGEKAVIRIFDPDVLLQDLGQLGFYPRDFRLFNSFIRRPNGIILVTGPTGSGKTTTLYSALRAISSPEVNIITIEDPIEMVVEEFNQVGVQQAIGVTFANLLRTVLRQDPDIIMVGEIRDKETADNAIQSALTGHLVLSTLHTNDAPSSITRMLDIGIPPYLLNSTIIGIVAQRLVRVICPKCKTERRLTDEEIDYLQLVKKPYRVFFGEGCPDCRGTGYRGRTGIFEVMDFSEKIRSVLDQTVNLTVLSQTARAEGMQTLRKAAVRKMLEGVTTYEEIIAVT